MSLASQALALATALGAAVKSDRARLTALEGKAALSSRLTATATRSAASYATSGLEVTVQAGKAYRFRATGQYRTALATTGIGLRMGGTCAATSIRYWETIYGLTATTYTHQVGIALNAAIPATTGVAVAATDYGWQIEGEIRVSTSGTLTVDMMSEVGSSVVTLQTDCYLEAIELP